MLEYQSLTTPSSQTQLSPSEATRVLKQDVPTPPAKAVSRDVLVVPQLDHCAFFMQVCKWGAKQEGHFVLRKLVELGITAGKKQSAQSQAQEHLVP